MKMLVACPDHIPPTPDFQPRILGGVSFNIDAMARGFAALGHQVTVACGVSGVRDAMVHGIPIDYDLDLNTLPGAIERRSPDIVIGVQSHWGMAALRTARHLGIPCVVYAQHPSVWWDHVGTKEMPDGWLWVMRWLGLHVNRPDLVQEVLHPPAGWIDRARIEVVAKTDDKVTLVNTSEFKGGKMLVALADALPRKRFLGMLNWGEQIIEPRPNITYEQAVWKVADVYARTRVLIMPSETEMFGSTAVQAQANGIPVLASDIEPLRDALEHGAIFLPPRDIEAWKRALLSLDDEGTYCDMQTKARANAARFNTTYELERSAAMMQRLIDTH